MATKKKGASEQDVIVAERLRELLHYDELTGEFTWLVSVSSSARVGDTAGSRHNAGYLSIRIDGRAYLAHRLAWLYVHGRFPAAQIDHINGNRADNKLANLRECSNAENCQNVKAHSDGSRVIGTSFDKRRRKWQAGIGVNGKRIFLGYFATQAEAGCAYRAAKQQHHPFGASNA